MNPYIQWPNHYFCPDDKACLLFGWIPGVGFDCEDPVEDARICFHLKGIKDHCFDIYEIIQNGMFKDFVELVTSGRIKAGKHNPRLLIW